MMSVAIIIERPVDAVWDYFVVPENWKKWRIYGLKRVSPGWQKGASLFWELGGSSLIKDLIPKRMVTIGGDFMDDIYSFESDGNESTIVTFQQTSPFGGAFFTDGGRAAERQAEENLQRLKELMEAQAE